MVDCILAKRLKLTLKNMYLNSSNSCNFILKIVNHKIKIIEMYLITIGKGFKCFLITLEKKNNIQAIDIARS